jgi:HEAT repeat protein
MTKQKVDAASLLQDLHSLDWKTRRNAAQALGTARDTNAVPPLIQVLQQDKSWTVRCRAAVALGRLKDERAIEPLIEAMKASNWQLFRHSFNAVVKFGDSAIPCLNKHSSDEDESPFFRNALVNALGAIGAESSMFSLLQRLSDRDLSVRIQAICALAQLKNETVVDRLIQVLENPEPLPEPSYPSEMAPELRGTFDPKPHILKTVAEALAVLNDRRAAEPLVELFAGHEPFGPQSEMLMAATNAVRQLGDVHTREFAELSTLLADNDVVIRTAAALSLAWLPDERGVNLLYSATRDSEPMARRAAEWSLQALQTILGYDVPMSPQVVAHILR